MPKKVPLTSTIKARIPERTAQKLTVYAQKHRCRESEVVREALKIFLRNVSTKVPVQSTIGD